MTRGDDALGDGGDLFWRLPRAKNDFGDPLAHRAMMVDAGEAQVFERRLAQKLKETVVGCLRRERSGADVSEERGQVGAGHLPDCFDFAPSPALI